MIERLRKPLRAVRTGAGEAIGAVVAAVPALERPFIAIGSRAAKWYWPSTLYWESHQALRGRLRLNGRRFRTVNVLGHALILDVTDGSVRLRFFHGEPYEPHLTTLIASTLRAGSVFIDVGANAGFFTLLGARCVAPGGRVFSFEPHPGARAQMQEVVALNGLGSVITVSDAASDHSTAAAPLFLAADSVLSTLDTTLAPLGDDHPFLSSINVPVSTLNDWLEAAGPPWTDRPIDLIKIDGEGGEERVIRGMGRTLARNPALAVVCETSAHSPADEMLRAAGYSVRALDVWGPVFGNYLYTRP